MNRFTGSIQRMAAIANNHVKTLLPGKMMVRVLMMLVLCLGVDKAFSQTDLYWDANGATAGTGGTGTWNTPGTWRSGSPTGTLGNWVDGSNAIFQGTAGTVTIPTTTTITTNNITFSTTGYVVTGATATGKLSLGSTNKTITIGSSVVATIGTWVTASNGNAVLAGTGGMTIDGSGELILAAGLQSSLSGGVTVQGNSILTIGDRNQPTGSSVYLAGGTGATGFFGGNNLVFNNGTLRIAASSNANCIVSGIGTITVNNTGTMVTWRTGTSSSMSPVLTTTSIASVTMNAGSTLSIGIGGNTNSGGTITLGALTTGGNFSIQGSSTTQTFKFGTISDGGFQMTLLGGGTSSSAGVNPINSYTTAGSSFTGSLVLGNSGGTEGTAYVPASLATTAITAGNITVYPNSQLSHAQAGNFGNAASTLTLHGNGLANTGGAINTTNAGTTTWLGATVLGANTTITPGTGNTLVLDGNLSGAFQLNKSGAGILTLNGANASNNSSTWLTNGTLTINSGSKLGSGGLKMGDDAGSNAVILNLNNSSQTIGSLTQGSASVTRTINLGTSHALTVVQTTAGTYAGTITGTTGSVSLDATSNNILTLSGANTYGGVTTIAGGTLRLGVANAIPVAATGGGVVLSGGTLSTGSGAGFSEGAVGSTNMGTLTLSTNNSTIALGTGSHSLFFAASNGVSWTANRILTITGWTGIIGNGSSGTAGKIFVGASTSGLTSIQLAQIKFTISAVDYPAMILSSGEIVPTLKYAITSVNGGTNPTSGSPFSITVQSQDFNGTARNVVTTTSAFSLTTNGNAGAIGGTTTGSIANGSSSTTVSGITLASSGTGVTLTATRTSGDQLITGISNTFTVDAGSAPTQLVITAISPASPIVGSTFTVTVQAQNGSNIASNVIANTNFTLSNAGGGTLSGTLTGTITAGSNQVILTGLSFTASGTGVTITATQTSGDPLSAGTSSGFLVSPADPTGVTATTASSTVINLAATANANSDNIIVAANTTNSFGTPVNGTAYAVNAALPAAGTVIYNGSAASLTSHSSLTSNTAFFYKTFSFDAGNLYSAGVSSNATTQAVPTTGTSGTLSSATATTAQAAINTNSIAPGGGATLSARGLAVGTSPSPTTLVSSGTTTGSYSQNLTGLNSQTFYYTRAYATNAGGTSYGNDISFRTLSAIPTGQASGFSATATGAGSFSVTLTGAATYPSSGATNAGYLLLYGTTVPSLIASPNGLPPASVISSGTQIAVIETNAPAAPTVTGLSATGLSPNTLYNLLVVPYTWDGTNTNTYNYLSAGAATTTVTTLSTGYYWNGGNNVANPANGGTGNWSDANNWRIDNNGAQATWADGNAAFLGGTAGTVTLSANVAPTSTTIQTAGYTLATSGATALALSGDVSMAGNGVTVAPITGADLTISGIISGASSVTKTDAGALFLNNGGNTYSGGTVINAGVLSIDGPNRLGSSAGAVTINNGTLQVTGNIGSSRNFTIGNAASTIDISNAISYTVNSAGLLSGSGRLNKTGAGTLVLPLANATSHTYSGGLTITGGTVQINKERDLGAIPGSPTVGNIVLDGGILASNATITINANRGIALGPVSGNGSGTVDVASGTSLTYGGILANNSSGTGSLIKTGAGTLALTATNTYSGGTTINGGILTVNGVNRLGATAGNLNINAGTLQVTTASFSSGRNFVLGDITSTIDIASAITYTQNNTAVISGSGALNKTSTGILVLGGSNTYTGATNISAGTLNLTGSLSASSAVTISSGAALTGTGNAAGAVIVNGTINPNGAAAIGTLNTGNETWNNGGTYAIDLNNVSGSAGTINDLLAITGSLNTSGTFNIALSGTITGFSYLSPASWTIATTTTGITNGATYSISTAGVTNNIGSGTFSLSVSGNNLTLNYTPGLANIAFSTSAGATTGLIGSSNNLIYRAVLAVTGNDATFTGVTYTTAGTYIPADIAANGFKLWYSTSSTFSTGTATQIGNSISSSTGFGELLAFTTGISQSLVSGSTYYLYVTVDYAVGATVGKTVNITSTVTNNYTFGSAVSRSGTSGVGTSQTITGYTTRNFNTTSASAPWLTTTNWTPSGVPSLSEIAQFNGSMPSNFVGINMNTAGGLQEVAAISFVNTNISGTIQNSSSSASGELRVYGAIINSNANTILNNTTAAATNQTLSATNSMSVGLANLSNQITVAGGTSTAVGNGFIINAPISQVSNSSSIKFLGGGTWNGVSGNNGGLLRLGGVNSFTGGITVGNSDGTQNGILQLDVVNAMSNTAGNNIIINPYSQLFLSATGTYTTSNFTLNLNGTGNNITTTYGAGALRTNGSSASYTWTGPVILASSSSISVDNSASTLTLSGNLSGSSNLTKVGTGALVLTGAGNSYTGSTTVSAGTLQLNKSGGTTIPVTNDVTISGTGNLKVSSNQTLNNLTLTAGTLTVDAGVTLTINGTFTYTGGAFSGTGTIVYGGSGALVYNGATQQTSTNTEWPSANGPFNVTAGSAGVVLHASRTVGGTLTLTGALNLNGQTLTANGAISGSGTLTGSSTSNLTIGGSAGTLNFTQTNSSTHSLNNLTLNSGSSATLGNDLDIYGAITLNTATLDMASKAVTLKSDINGTARVGDLTGSTLSNADNVTVERFIGAATPKAAWRLMTAPLRSSGANNGLIFDYWQNGGVNTTGIGTQVTGPGGASGTTGIDAWTVRPSMQYFDHTVDQNLHGVTDTKSTGTATPLFTKDASAANKSYFIFTRGDRSVNPGGTSNNTTFRPVGTLQTGDQTFATATGAENDNTLVGNPYAAPVDLALFRAANLNSNAKTNYYYWDPYMTGAYGVGAYVTVSYDQNGIETISGGATTSHTRFLQSGQAMFLERKADVSGTVASVTFKENQKGSTNAPIFLLPNGRPDSMAVNLNVLVSNAPVLVDGIIASFDDSYNATVDDYDASKFNNIGESVSFKRSGKILAIERRPLPGLHDTLYLNMANMKAGNSYRFDFAAGFSNPMLTAFLQDSYVPGSNYPINLITGNSFDFSVTADAATAAANRFRIVFAAAGPLAVSFKTVKAYEQGRNINVEWKVENESDMQQYEVEKSTNGTSFAKVNTTAAQNQSSVTYTWTDINPVEGYNFYRIRSIANSGEIKYSSIVKVLIGKTAPGISIYPNPIEGNTVNLQMKGMPAGNYTIRLVNANGQLIQTLTLKHAAGNSTESLPLSSQLGKGTYILEIIKPDNSKTSIQLMN